MANTATMLRFSLALLCAIQFCGGVAAAQSAPAPAATPNGPVMARAIDWYHRLQTGEIDRSQLGSKLSDTLTPSAVAAVKTRLAAYGDPVSFTQKQIIERAGATMFVYDLRYKSAPELLYLFTLLANGTIVGLQFAPAN
jgi:hypothetical protein